VFEGREGLPRTSTSAAANRSRTQAKSLNTHVSQRIRDKRNERGMSQTEVANALGVTFQQVRKYERGTNRVGASRILSLPLQIFFEGLENQADTSEDDAENVVHLMKPDTIELMEAYYKVDNLHVRRRILSTIRSISFAN